MVARSTLLDMLHGKRAGKPPITPQAASPEVAEKKQPKPPGGKKVGRPPLGDRAMTEAEKKRRQRALKKEKRDGN